MESERLTIPESQLKRGEINVREFVRQVAKSDLYKSRFFDICPRYRFIELNFKHLLGRSPESFDEMKYHSGVLDAGDYEAEIDSYLDSDEYQDAYGDYLVPFYRGYKTQTGKKMIGFTHMIELLPSASNSDKGISADNQPILQRSLINNIASGDKGVTDIQKLLEAVLSPKIQPSIAPQPEEVARSEAYQALQSQCQEQLELLETLRKQLAQLQPFGAIGTSQTSYWKSYNLSPNNFGDTTSSLKTQSQTTVTIEKSDSYEALQQQFDAQKEEIASLQAKISNLRSVAAIGEARLNKWRSRSFSRR